ncbi:hypothetical protein M5X06_13655 [Paenibacillus alvei]|uniref:Uncharacterized protein n=1 Tax=Paenibacillus alvei TaxID=44250 RepID=A0ABT4GSH8_PAEAL|nr:hypothetical protein [Paenibacillus alvei]MCY7485586.1 hypothetical protein [Paenibacillus alvei]MCY9759644.1 hypothetical protein [Paenibacillus alvei]MCY9767855.1 hypothetical protein [Paenibacillus alvei]
MNKTFQPLSKMLLAVFHLIHALDIRWDQKNKELHVVQILSMVDTLRELHLCTYRRVQVYKQTVIDAHTEHLDDRQIKEVLDSVRRTQFLLGRWNLTNRLLVEQLQDHLRYLEDYYRAFNQVKLEQPNQKIVQPVQSVNQVSNVWDAVKVAGAVKKRRPPSSASVPKNVRKPRSTKKQTKMKPSEQVFIVTNHQVNEDVQSNQNRIVSKIGSRIYYRK